MLMWPKSVFPLMWLIELEISVDDMKMGFKVKHKDKLHFTYKNEGGDFQADAIFQEFYTYQVYTRNDPTPSKYLNQGLSPLHSRVINMFDSVKDDH